MVSRIAVVIAVVAIVACGGSSPPPPAAPALPAESSPQPSPAPTPATTKAEPPAAPPVAAAPAPPPEPKKKPLYERLHDTDGKVAGLAGFSIKRKPSKNHCGGVQIVTTRGKKLAKDDEPLAAVYKLEFPKGLFFDPDPKHKLKREASIKKFDKLLQDIALVGGDARKHYEAKLAGAGDAAAKVAAVARLAQIHLRLATLLARAEIPADVRTGDFAEDKIEAYCDRLLDVAEPLHALGEDAMRHCAEKASAAGAGWWTEVCVAP